MTRRQHGVHFNYVSTKKNRPALYLLGQKTLGGYCRGYVPRIHNRDYNKMAAEYPLEIEFYSDKIKSCN
jgi:hypothetical protein